METPPTVVPATFAPSNGEIPVENVEGALSGGDYDRGIAALDQGDIDTARAAYESIHHRDPKEGAGSCCSG